MGLPLTERVAGWMFSAVVENGLVRVALCSMPWRGRRSWPASKLVLPVAGDHRFGAPNR
jgi:hypothetical protein